jgi:glutaredoxin
VFKVRQVLVYSRSGCHLCEQAIAKLSQLKKNIDFELTVVDIDLNQELINLYSEQVPVITIDGQIHDFFKVDEERFLKELRATS